jgi:putative glycosyltransferase (TIGR04348 family)
MNSNPNDMRIAVASPYPLSSPKGNTVTARRVGGILRGLGYAARESHGWDGAPADVLVSLHATKGAAAVAAYRAAHPEGKVVVVLTGTDLYRELAGAADSGATFLASADCLVVSQEASLRSIPAEFREKARVVWQSADMDLPDPQPEPEPGRVDLTVIGHMRTVKNPFAAVRVVHAHPEWTDVRVWQLGEALKEVFALEARQWEAREHRYRWLGNLPREEVIRWLCRSAATVNSSWMEGGPNVVTEAILVGAPVLASRAEGNVGLLGEDYGGLFHAGDEAGLAALIGRLRSDAVMREDLRRQVMARRDLFSREREMDAWRALLAELTGPSDLGNVPA